MGEEKTCGICGNPASAVKSHILPHAVFKRLKGRDSTFVIIDSGGHHPISELQGGFFQQYLLCDKHEAATAALDTYWASFHDHRCGGLDKHRGRAPWTMPNVDAEKLALFVVSVLIRAHLTTHPRYETFSLGDRFQQALEAFLQEQPFSLGFRLAAQLPIFKGKSSGFNSGPRMNESGLACLWVGRIRFVLAFPGWHLSPNELRFMNHGNGLCIWPVDADATPEIRNNENFLRTLTPEVRVLPTDRNRGVSRYSWDGRMIMHDEETGQ